MFVKLACAPTPFRIAEVGEPPLPYVNCTDEEVVPAAHKLPQTPRNVLHIVLPDMLLLYECASNVADVSWAAV